jgi:hypothetical protein
MKAIKILPTNSKSVKKCMTLYGIKVRRCVKNGNGLLISVQNTEEDIKLAQNFFNEFNKQTEIRQFFLRNIKKLK